ncbi:MAG: hypothetical protein ACYSRQ_04965, partial [Planctomycetota bacterium]
MKLKEDIIFQWIKPQEINRHALDQMIKNGKTAVPLILLISGVFFLLFGVLMKVLFPFLEIPLSKVLLIIYLVFSLTVICLYFVLPLFCRYSKTKYKITEKGIFVGSNICKWNWIEAFTVSDDTLFADKKVVYLQVKQRVIKMYLPEGEMQQQIIHLLGDKILVYRDEVEGFNVAQLTVNQ